MSADPGVAVVRLAEDVDEVVVGFRVAEPGLVRGGDDFRRRVAPESSAADGVEDVAVEAAADLVEADGRDGDFEVAVLSRLLASEQVQRPARRYAPGY